MKLKEILEKHAYLVDTYGDYPIIIFDKRYQFRDKDINDMILEIGKEFIDLDKLQSDKICSVIFESIGKYKTLLDEKDESCLNRGHFYDFDEEDLNETLSIIKDNLTDRHPELSNHISCFCDSVKVGDYPFTINSPEEWYKTKD